MDAQLIQQQYEKESGVSFTDSLTGLYNHGFFQTVLAWEEERFKRHAGPFTLGLINIDSFMGYNRSHGHAQGDQILKKIAVIIKDNIRQVDIAARYAGDVFAILLIKSEAAMAKAAAERIREAVAKEFDNTLTVSVGLASIMARLAAAVKFGNPRQERMASAISVPRPGPSSATVTRGGLPMACQTASAHRPTSSPKI